MFQLSAGSSLLFHNRQWIYRDRSSWYQVIFTLAKILLKILLWQKFLLKKSLPLFIEEFSSKNYFRSITLEALLSIVYGNSYCQKFYWNFCCDKNSSYWRKVYLIAREILLSLKKSTSWEYEVEELLMQKNCWCRNAVNENAVNERIVAAKELLLQKNCWCRRIVEKEWVLVNPQTGHDAPMGIWSPVRVTSDLWVWRPPGQIAPCSKLNEPDGTEVSASVIPSCYLVL